MKTSPRGFARRNVWRQFVFTFAAIVALFQSAFAQSGHTDQESPPVAPTVNDPLPYETKRENKAFEIKDWSFGVSNPTTIGSATGGGGGKSEFDEFSIPKVRDPAAPFFHYYFETIFTTHIDWSGSGDEGPEEDIEFVYGKLGIKYFEQDPKSAVRGPLMPWGNDPLAGDTKRPKPEPKPTPTPIAPKVGTDSDIKLHPLFAIPRVNEATGELFVSSLDLVIPGRGLNLVWGRTYRSKIGMDTPMGVGWDFSYNIRAALSGRNITVQDGQNRIDTYFLQSDGSFSTDELFRRGTLSQKVFTLEFADRTRWIFKPLNSSPTSGKIDKIIDRNSNQIQFQYDGAGRLFLIIDSLNRPFQISYDGANRIQAVQDFTGRMIQYQHLNAPTPGIGDVGDLVVVRSQAVTGTPIGNDFPSGKTAQFTYSTGLGGARDHNLLTARDGNNVQWFQAVYTTRAVTTDFLYDRVASEIVGTAGETKVFTYLAKSGAATKTIVNDPIGNVHESLFDLKNRLIDLRQFTGRSTPGVPVTETTNRPMNPVRPTDPPFFQTTIDWNPDSLPTRIIFPRGNGVEMVYQRDFNTAASSRERGNLRVHRQLLTSGAPLVSSFEHQPGFGTCEFRGNNFEYPGTSCEFRPGKWTQTDYNFETPSTNLLCRTQATGTIVDDDELQLCITSLGRDYFSLARFMGTFRTRHTDARGFTWTCARDANGNALSVTRPDSVTTDIEHNANGQLTAIVRPPNHTGHRERDEWHYYSGGPQNGYLQSFIRDAGGLNLTAGFTHDSVGNVTQIVDPRGRDAQFFVNQLNQIVQITSRNAGTPGRYLTNIYRDANNRITHVDVQNKDEFGNVGSPPFFVTSFGYDSLDHVTSITRDVTSSHTVTTQFFYNAIRDLIELRSPLAVSGTQADARVQFAYDERDLPFTRTAAPGSSIATGSTYTYDLNGNLSRLETGAPAGSQHTATFVYDGFDRLSQMTSPVGTQMQFSYNPNHQPTQRAVTGTFLDPDGNPTTGPIATSIWNYDSTGFCAARVDSFFDVTTQMPISDGARTTNYSYDPARNVISVTDDSNHTTQFSYDGANRLTRITDPKSNLVDYTYDANGNVISRSRTDKSDTAAPDQVFVLTNVFDGLDRLITSTDNVGNARSNSYDSRSNRVRYVDPRNHLTQFRFDGLNRPTRRGRDMNANNSGFDPNDIVTGYTWDDNSRFAGRTNPNNYATQYAYDAVGRLTARNNPDATSKSWSYDPWGNATQSNDENGTVCINNYDNNNRLKQRQIIPGPGVSHATTFEIYDYPGDYPRRERAINNASMVRFTYDSLGRLTSERLGSQITTYTHDAVGNLLTLQSPGGRVMAYSHDAANLCTGLSLIATSDGDLLGPISNYRYIGRRIESATHRNGTSTSCGYDGFVGAPPGSDLGWGQLAASATIGPGSTVVDQRTFKYDANQNLSEREDTRSGGPRLLHHYDYDPADRNAHTQVTAPGPVLVRDTIYNYDLNGNRVAVNGFNTPDPGSYFQNAATPVPADAQMNQYTSTPRGGYLYDENGNRINLNGGGANTTYTYDYANRLVDLTDATTSVRVANYQYDALGRRIQKTLDPDGTPNTTNFFYTGRSVLEEREGGGAVVAPYVNITDITVFETDVNGSAHTIGESCDDNCWWVMSPNPSPYLSDWEQRHETVQFAINHDYYSEPLLGGYASISPVEMRRGGTNYTYDAEVVPWLWLMTNADGNAAERYEYEDFGDPHFFDGAGNPLPSSAIGNPYLFKGMRFDGESGLYATVGHYDIDTARDVLCMFDPKIGASLQRESSHAVNTKSFDHSGIAGYSWGESPAILSHVLEPDGGLSSYTYP